MISIVNRADTPRQNMRPFTHAFTRNRGSVSALERSSKWHFCVYDSESMRYVGGGVLNNPDTRANQIGEGGLRIEPGGREESFAYAPQIL